MMADEAVERAEEIGDAAFDDCRQLTQVDIP